MKKLLLSLILISSYAYANEVAFEDKKILKFTNGNKIKADRIANVCGDMGLTQRDCHKVIGVDALDQHHGKAFDKCLLQRYAPPKFNGMDAVRPNEAPGARKEEIGGVRHTRKECHKDGQCDWYMYSESQKQAAGRKSANEAIDAAVKKHGAGNDVVTNIEGGSKIWGDQASGAVYSYQRQYEQTFSDSRQKSPLTQHEVSVIYNYHYLIAYIDPGVMGFQPNTIRIMDKPYCFSESTQGDIKNPFYNVKTADELKRMDEARKEEEAKKKKADDEAKHKAEEEAKKKPKKTTEVDKDIPDLIEPTGGDLFAGEPTPLPADTAIVRAIDPEVALNMRTAFDNCVDREKAKLKRFEGSTTIDFEAMEAEDTKKKSAEDALARGFCTESVYGREYCQKFKNHQASVRKEGAEVEALEQKKAAEEAFHLTGACNANVLGSEFCKKAKAKWIVNPVIKTPEKKEGLKIPEYNPSVPRVVDPTVMPKPRIPRPKPGERPID